MKDKIASVVETSYRTYYGKLFAVFFNRFGVEHVNEIEDAIQNAFYKALRSWKPDQVPDNKESWLFIVARNDILNQIKKGNRTDTTTLINQQELIEDTQEDLRLNAILFLATSQNVKPKVKVLFILKNIFGLHIKEISECTLLTQEAIYKSIKRAKDSLQQAQSNTDFNEIFKNINESAISIVEEVLYAVFNIGFDSFNEKVKRIVNEDLCLEALALSKMLVEKFKRKSTKNMLSLFCFHLARIPSKINHDKLVAFNKQEKANWNQDLIKMGFHYLERPAALNKYFVEALITSKHMTATKLDEKHWDEIIDLYHLLLSLSNSPIAKLNLCYCLSKAQRHSEAKELITAIAKELPSDHVYLSLVQANIFQDSNTSNNQTAVNKILKNINQEIRREFILENFLTSK